MPKSAPMGRQKRFLLLGLVVLPLVAAVAVAVVWIGGMDSELRDQTSSYFALMLAATTAVVGLVAWAIRSAVSPTRARVAPDGDIVERVAARMLRDWSQHASDRRIADAHGLLPIRWTLTDAPVAPRASAVLASPPRFSPLPGSRPIDLADLADGGGRIELHAAYAGLSSGRLVVVGPPGAGKSSAAIFLLLDALKYRTGAIYAQGNGGVRVAPVEIPVPILYTLHGWNPEAGTVGSRTAVEFVTDKLLDDFPNLPRLEIEEAVQMGRFMVILDGLDEVPSRLMSHVLNALSEAPFRLVLLSRTAEAADATKDGTLSGSIAIELQSLTVTEAVRYLLNKLPQPTPSPWQNVIQHLMSSGPAKGESGESDAVAIALCRPLLLVLASEAYSARSTGEAAVDELLDYARFPTPASVEHHLLDRIVDVSYAPTRSARSRSLYGLSQAKYTLAFIADQLAQRQVRDLAWWEIPSWFECKTRAPQRAQVSGRAFARPLKIMITIGLVLGALSGTATGLLVGVAFGIVVGAVGGLIFGFSSDADLEQGPVNPASVWRSDARYVLLHTVGPLTACAFGSAAALALAIDQGNFGGAWLWSIALGGSVGLATALTGILPLYLNLKTLSHLGPIVAAAAVMLQGMARVTDFFPLQELGSWLSIVAGVVLGLSISGLNLWAPSPWLALSVLSERLARGEGTPRDLMRFLADAQRRGVLRSVGGVYQFRHATLQDRLAEYYRSSDPLGRQIGKRRSATPQTLGDRRRRMAD